MTTAVDIEDLPTIRVVHNMARAGGTLIARCIAVMENITLLSEIHPLGHRNRHFNAMHQYQSWYEDLNVADHTNQGFDKTIDRLYQRCVDRNTLLVLRDWAHIDYIGPPARRAPGYTFSLNERLSNRYQILRCAIVRHPIENWRSLSKLSVITDNKISIEQFMYGYHRYLNELEGCPIIRYEDFTLDPVATMSRLCDSIDIPFDKGFIDRWQHYRNVTGDVHNRSRAGGSVTIKHFPLASVPPSLQKRLANNRDFKAVMQRLEYDLAGQDEALATER